MPVDTHQQNPYSLPDDDDAPPAARPAAAQPPVNPYSLPDGPGGTEASVGGVLRDTGIDLVQGLTDIGSQAYGLGNVLTGGKLDRATRTVAGLADRIATSAGNAITGQNVQVTGEQAIPTVAQGFQRMDQSLEGMHSEHRQALEQQRSQAMQEAAKEHGTLGEAWAGLTSTLQNPSLLMGDLTRSAVSMVAPGAAAGAVVRRFGPGVAEAAAKRALAGGATREVAAEAGREAAAKLGERAVIGVTGVGQVGGGANVDAINRTHELAPEVLAANPKYQELLASGMDPLAARDEMARGAGLVSFALAAPLSIAASKFTGAGRQFSDMATGNYAGKGIADFARAALREGAQETFESGGEALAGNIGQQQYGDVKTPTMQGVGGAMAVGGLAGMVMGGGEHIVGRMSGRHGQQEVPEQDADQGADGAGAPNPAASAAPATPPGTPPGAPPAAPAASAPLPPDAGPLTRAAAIATGSAGAAESRPAFPFTTAELAQKQADDLSRVSGFPYQVGPHPSVAGRFAALPVMETPAEQDKEQAQTAAPAAPQPAAAQPGSATRVTGFTPDNQMAFTEGSGAAVPVGAITSAEPVAPLTEVDLAAHMSATSPHNDLAEPSARQSMAGNYRKGRAKDGGLMVSFENSAGSVREDKENDRPPWRTALQDHYGYFKGVPARAPDKEHVDVFVKPGTAKDYAGPAFVIDQLDEAGNFDEPKVILGASSLDEARATYLRNYEQGFETRIGNVTELTMEALRERLNDQSAFLQPQAPLPGTATPAQAEAQAAPDEDMDALQAQYDAQQQQHAKAVEDTSAAIGAGQMPVFRVSEHAAVAIHPSAQNEGMFQATRYSDKGVIGDSQYHSVEDALRQEGLLGRARMEQDEADGFLGQSLEGERAHQEQQTAPAAPATGNPMLDNPASWVIRDKQTGEVIMETFDRNKVDALNTEKYEAVPAAQHLGELNDPASLAGKVARGEKAAAEDTAAAPSKPWERPAQLEWERGTNNAMEAALPDGSTLYLHSDDEGTTLNRFDAEGTELRSEQPFASIDEAKAAAQREYDGIFAAGTAAAGKVPELAPAVPAADKPFDSKAWDKERDERIQASKAAGHEHLDQVPRYVESMRGRPIYYVHDPKERGVVRTVDNRGNVYVNWSDKYSADKNSASPSREGRKEVFQTSLGPTDLKDYVFADKGPAAAKTPAKPAKVNYPKRKLGMQHAASGPDEEYNDHAWANVAAANMAKGDTFKLNGKKVTVESISGKTLKLKDAQGKVRTLNPMGVAWDQFVRDLGGQLMAENLQANNPLAGKRALLAILKRDPAVHVDANGSVHLRDGGPVNDPAKDKAPASTAKAAAPAALAKAAPLPKRAAALKRLRATDPFLAMLADKGVALSAQSDLGLERGARGNRLLPGLGTVLRRDGANLDELALYAVEEGFLTQADLDDDTDNGAVGKISDMIYRAVAKREVVQDMGSMEDEAQRTADARAEQELLTEAAALGIDTDGRDILDIAEAVRAWYATSLDLSEKQQDTLENHADPIDAIISDADLERAFNLAPTDTELTDEQIDSIFGHAAPREGSGTAQEGAGRTALEAAETDKGAPRSAAGQDADQVAGAPEFALAGQTLAEGRAAAEAAEQRAEAAAEAERQAKRREAADRERDNFSLTGSNRPADVLAAQGQTSIFDNPAPAPAPDSALHRRAWLDLGERVDMVLGSGVIDYDAAATSLGISAADAKAAHALYGQPGGAVPQHAAPGWRDTTGGIRFSRAPKPKRERIPQEQYRVLQRDHRHLNAAEKKAFEAFLAARHDGARIRAQLDQHAGTPWAKQAIEGIFVRQAIMAVTRGETPAFQSMLDNPLADNLRALLARTGMEGVMLRLDQNGYLGEAEKAVNNVSGSFINCDPSKDCATYCYATRGHYRMVFNVLKAELVTMAIEHDPQRAAARTALEYKGTPEFHNNKALRLFDKGDGNAAWVPYVRALNELGVRTHIFSKNPAFLRAVPEQNLRLLSIDQSNLDLADANPDLKVAFVYDKSPGQDEFLAKLIARGQLGVVLPIQQGQRVAGRDEFRALKEAVEGVGPYVCPIDVGIKALGDNLGQEGWNCTRCDKDGALGCFFGQPTAAVRALAMRPKGASQAERLLQLKKELYEITEGRTAPAGAGQAVAAAGRDGTASVQELRGEIDGLLERLLALYDEGAEGGNAGRSGGRAEPADRGGREKSRPARRTIPILPAASAKGKPRTSRARSKPTGYQVAQLKAAIAPVIKRWQNKPKGGIHAVQSVGQLPPSLLARIPTEALRDMRGVYDPVTDAVYLVADRLHHAREAQFVLGHEVLGHVGLHAVLPEDQLDREMNRLRLINPELATAAVTHANKFKTSLTVATEEALADWQGEGREIRGWQKFMAAIQEALRAIGLGGFADWLEGRTQAETLALLRAAREAITGQDAPRIFGTAEALRYSAAGQPFWKSALSEQIARMPTKAAPPGQWANALAGLQAKGVKKEEIEWSGIREYLALQDPKQRLSKDDVLEFLSTHGVQLSDRIFGEPEPMVEADLAKLQQEKAEFIEKTVEAERDKWQANLDAAIEEMEQKLDSGDFVDEGEDEDGEPVFHHMNVYYGGDGIVESYATYDEAQEAVDESRDYYYDEAVKSLRNEFPSFDEDEAANDAEADWDADHDEDMDEEKPMFLSWRTVPGGEDGNYRELLIQLANLPGGKLLRRKQVFDKYQPQLDALHKVVEDGHSQHPDPDERRRQADLALTAMHQREVLMRRRDLEAKAAAGEVANFNHDHWNAGNVLAHVRFDTRRNADGETVLQIHEIQSDWGEKGRDYGFDDEVATELLAIEQQVSELGGWAKVGARLDVLEREFMQRTGRTSIYAGGKVAATFRDGPEGAEWQRLQALQERQQEVNAGRRLGTGHVEYPSGPYVKRTEAWVALAIKRTIAYAAEHGIDHVALPTGAQANTAFSLEKRVSIEYARREDDKVWLHVSDVNRGGATLTERTVTLAELPGIVGKEVTQKIERGEGGVKFSDTLADIKQRGEPTGVVQDGDWWYITFANGERLGTFIHRADAERNADMIRDIVLHHEQSRVLEGDDLKVGGEPMRKFYDQMVVNIANDVLKKLGGGRVEKTSITLPVDNERAEYDNLGSYTGPEYSVEQLQEALSVAQQDGDPVRVNPLTGTAMELGTFNSTGVQSMLKTLIRRMRSGASFAEAMMDDGISSPFLADLVGGKYEVLPKGQRRGVRSEQPSFAITPALRERVMSGMPLFSRGDDDKAVPTIAVDGRDRPAVDNRGRALNPAFWRWFGASKARDGQGRPLVLYHGTGADFTEFSTAAHRSVLNNQYQGDGFHFSADPAIASRYAGAARNQFLNKDKALALADAKLPPLAARTFRAVIEQGYEAAWELPDAQIRAILDEATAAGIDLNDLLDIAEYVEGSNYDAGREPYFDAGMIFGGNGRELPDYVRDSAVLFGLQDALPGEAVMPVYLKIDNLLRTSDREAAKNARKDGYDGVYYFGPGTVGGVPEYIVFDPAQVKSVTGNRGTYDSATPDLRMSRAAAARGMEPAAVVQLVDEVTARWGNAPPVKVVASVEKLPASLLAKIPESARADLRGLYNPRNNTVYLVANRLHSAAEAQFVLAHEVLGHAGLAAIMDPEVLAAELNRLRMINPALAAEARMLAKKYGYSLALATEEALADMAGQGRAIRGWQKFVAKVQAALRALGLDAVADWIERHTAAETMALLARAKGAVVGQGGVRSFGSAEAARFSDGAPTRWYSELARRVERMPMKSAPAAQWVATLEGMTRSGVKRDEIAWSGVTDWLSMQDGKVGKAQVLDYLAVNGVRVSEVLHEGMDRKFDGVDRLQLPGSIHDSYRELLLTLDSQEVTPDRGMNEQEIELLKSRLAARPALDPMYDDELDELRAGGQDAIDMLVDLEERVGIRTSDLINGMRGGSNAMFRHHHWNEANVLAHVRFNDRFDADGKQVLFIEELQSDWGQQGKRLGFRNGEPATMGQADVLAIMRDLFGERGEQEVALMGWENLADVFNNPNTAGDLVADGGWTEDDAMRFMAEATRRGFSGQAVPAAPFVTTTPGWVSLAVKRVIMYAAEQGYERIAFINGTQSADRYDLSKEVGEIVDFSGTLKAFDKEGYEVFSLTIPESEWASHIGKEAADKLAAMRPDEDGQRSLMGDDLKIGGLGMKAFYDQIVPKVAATVLKKLGAGTVGTVRLASTGTTFDADGLKAAVIDYLNGVISTDEFLEGAGLPLTENDIEDRLDVQLEPGPRQERYAAGFVRDMQKRFGATAQSEQFGITITPELRETAAAGMPLFSRTGEDADGSSRERAAPGANVTRLAAIMGPQMYGDMGDMGPVTVKELFQNAFDALKGAIEHGQIKGGKISIDLDQDARTITVTDDGTGMTPQIINSAFLTIAGTHKETARPSGSFGLAKMLFILGNERMSLVTVRDGVESRLDTTGAQMVAAYNDPEAAPDIVTRKTDAPSGTTVTVTLPATYRNPSSGENMGIRFPDTYSVNSVVSHSPLFENIEVSVNGKVHDVGSRFRKDDYTTFATVDFDWGSARIIVSKAEVQGWESNYHVLSNGLWQFSTTLREDPFSFHGERVPRTFFVNVEPRVTPTEPGYPFNMTRQGFAKIVQDDFDKISKYMSLMYGANKAAENAAGFGQIEYINPDNTLSDKMQLAPELDDTAKRNMLVINEGDQIEVHDGRMVVNGREVPVLTSADMERAKIDVTKFKIPQHRVDATRPMVHDNLDVVTAGTAAERAELDRLTAAHSDARLEREVAKDLYYKVREASSAELLSDTAPFTEPNTRAVDKAWVDYQEANYRADNLRTQVENFRDSMSKELLPITTVMREKYGSRFDAYLGDIGRIFMALRDAVVAEDGKRYSQLATVPVGTSFDTDYYGVHTMTPFRGMFLNPSLTAVDDSGKTSLQAAAMIGTMKHEMAHYMEMNHSERFIHEMQLIDAMLESSDRFNIINLRSELRSILDRNHDIYADLNRTIRSLDVKNRGVKLADAGSRSGRDAGPADAMAGARAPGQDDGRVAQQAGTGAGNGGGSEVGAGTGGAAGTGRAVTATPQFRRWFGKSKVVDANGQPLVVYRGLSQEHENRDGLQYWTEDREAASEYGQFEGKPHNVVPAYLSIKNPFKLMDDATARRLAAKLGVYWGPDRFYSDIIDAKPDAAIAYLRAKGHDGIVMDDGTYSTAHRTFVSFAAAQVKSAIGNSGAFDAADPDIRFSRTGQPLATINPAEQRFEGVMREALNWLQSNGKTAELLGVPPEVALDNLDLIMGFAPGFGEQAKEQGRAIWERALVAFKQVQRTGSAFDRWFKGSKVVDAAGKPLTVYHGTRADIGQFKPGKDGIFFTDSPRIAGAVYANGHAAMDFSKVRAALDQLGFGKPNPDDAVFDRFNQLAAKIRKSNRYFNPEPQDTGGSITDQIIGYLEGAEQDGNSHIGEAVGAYFGVPVAGTANGANVLPVHLALRNPLEIDGSAHSFDDMEQDGWIARARAEGHDGLIIRNYDDGGFGGIENYRSAGRHTVYIAFRPEQVKSAVGNSGKFDGSDPDLRFSRGDDTLPQHPTETPAFKAWFGKSRVTDIKERPKVVYHGTKADFTAFDMGKLGHDPNHHGSSALGLFFSQEPPLANEFAGQDGHVMPVYLAINNPYHMTPTEAGGLMTREDAEAMRRRLEKQGYDGVRIARGGIWVAFRPEQVKSALSNSGSYDPANPDVRFSRAGETIHQVADTLRSGHVLRRLAAAIRELFSSHKSFNNFNLYDKTFSTQYNKARKDADFRAVFEPAQQQVDDTAHYAIEAEQQAPDVLVRMDGMAEVWEAFKKGGAEYKADLAVASKALFANIEGVEGVHQVVYTPYELRRDFNMTDRQITLYQQVRRAVDTSIERLAQTTIMAMGRSEGLDVRALKDMSLEDTVAVVKDQLREKRAQDYFAARMLAINEGTEEPAPPVPQSEDIVAQRIDGIVETAKHLQAAGYMPAMRFGHYAITVRDPSSETGDPLYFATYETQFAAHAAYRRLLGEFPGMEVERSVMNDEQYKMFKGVSPETVELFARFSGMDKTEAYHDYIALARANRYAKKHEIERKGIAGFSEDAARVLSSFMLSNARQSAINVNASDIAEALASKRLARKGDVHKEAQRLVEYINNPNEEAAKLRGFMFTYFIGGSVASALVNLTQPVLQTLPWLTEFVGGARASGMLLAAARMATARDGSKVAPHLRNAFRRADNDGLTRPKEIHSLMADADASAVGSNFRLRALVQAWGGFFGQAEAFNRRVTFLAAYQAALDMGRPALKDKGFADEYEFAQRALHETQGLYSKVNRPDFGRGATGAVLLTFKQFSITYLEMLMRMPWKQKAIALALLTVGAGLEGWPFAENIEDLVDTLGQSMGYNTNTKRSLRRASEDMLGEFWGEMLLHGAGRSAGVDVAGRIGMGRMIPGTALLKPADAQRDVGSEMYGPVGSLVKSVYQAIGKVQAGDIGGAVTTVAPTALKNAAAGVEMMTSGEYRDSRGRPVMEVSKYEGALKFFGLQPGRVAQQSAVVGDLVQDASMLASVRNGLLKRWARAIIDGDAGEARNMFSKMQEWNRDNPEYRVFVTPAALRSRVLELRRDRAGRTIRRMPPSLRAQAMADLE